MRHTVINLEAARRGLTLLIEKSQAILVGERAFSYRLVEDSITAAEYGLVINLIGETYSRTERLLVGVLWTLPSVAACTRSQIRVSPEDISGPRVRKRLVNRRKPIKRFGSR